jgi:hypothetical protein
MPSIFSKILSLPPGGLGRVVVGSKPINNSTGITVTAAIFFDGTGNNRNNTAQRRMAEHNAAQSRCPAHAGEGVTFNPAGYEQYGKNKKGQPVASYEAGYSNVSILERMNVRGTATKKFRFTSKASAPRTTGRRHEREAFGWVKPALRARCKWGRTDGGGH